MLDIVKYNTNVKTMASTPIITHYLMAFFLAFTCHFCHKTFPGKPKYYYFQCYRDFMLVINCFGEYFAKNSFFLNFHNNSSCQNPSDTALHINYLIFMISFIIPNNVSSEKFNIWPKKHCNMFYEKNLSLPVYWLISAT